MQPEQSFLKHNFGFSIWWWFRSFLTLFFNTKWNSRQAHQLFMSGLFLSQDLFLSWAPLLPGLLTLYIQFLYSVLPNGPVFLHILFPLSTISFPPISPYLFIFRHIFCHFLYLRLSWIQSPTALLCAPNQLHNDFYWGPYNSLLCPFAYIVCLCKSPWRPTDRCKSSFTQNAW